VTDEISVAGRYRLGERIGSGAMGVVWQAHDERLHRTVAVKQLLLQPGLTAAQAEEARARCMREGRIAARLAHPNAITVYDVAEHDGEPWLIMEYLPSKSLAAVIAERRTLPPDEVARIGREVAAALVAAHAAGIVHRDVKPANVLLGDDGTVKITDFGISRATGDVTVTATGMLAGTPAYLAPEVAKGKEPTPASDVFSLGSTLYTAIEGHSPFGRSENTLALLYAVAAGQVSPPRQAGPLTALLMQLLRADPAERPSMQAAREALAAAAAGRPVTPLTDRPTVQHLGPRPQPGQHPHTPPRPVPAAGYNDQRRFTGTRLDPHPFAEPTQRQQTQHQPPPQQHQRPGGYPPLGPPSGPNTGSPGNRPSAKPPNNVRSVVLTVLAIVAAALVGILVASMVSTNGDRNNAGQPDTQQPLPQSTAAGTATATSSTPSTASSTPTTTSEAPAAPGPEEQQQAVRDYYAQLPADPNAAWDLLTDRAQRKSGAKDGYLRFWQRISSVEVLQTGYAGDQVTARLKFVTTENRESTEDYVFTVVRRGDRLLIDRFGRAGVPDN